MVGDLAGDEQDAGDDREARPWPSRPCRVAAEALHEAHERPGEKRGDQERHAEAERIGREQDRPARDRLLGSRRRRGSVAEHRADARRPADGEGEAHDIGSRPGRPDGSSTWKRASRCRSAIRNTPRKCRPIDDDRRSPPSERQDVPGSCAHLSRPDRSRRRRAERDEHGRKPSTKASAEKNTMRRATAFVPSPVNWSRLTPAM